MRRGRPAIETLFYLAPVCLSLGHGGIDSRTCTIPTVNLTQQEFALEYKGRYPVIIPRSYDAGAAVRESMQREQILSKYADVTVFPASASSSARISFQPSTLAHYITELMQPLDVNASLAEGWYLFGSRDDHAEMASLTSKYDLPLGTAADGGYLQWGLGGLYSGASFHRHGAAYSETIIGRKRWYLRRPGATKPAQQGLQLRWVLEHIASTLNEDDVLECTLEPSQVLYIPPMWWHATLNLENWTAFISTFTLESYSMPDSEL